MKEKLWAFCRKLISLALNLSILYMETIAMPISWDYGHELVFTMYTELSNMFNVASVCWWVCGSWAASSPGGSCPAGSNSSNSGPPAA